MEKKCLIVASVSSMIGQFILPNIELLQSIGYNVTVAANFTFGSTFSNVHAENLRNKLINMNIEIYDIAFFRNIFDFRNIIAYRQIKNLIVKNRYLFIHCHSPIGGVITRAACKRTQLHNTKIIYTAHGFHFYKKAPLINWLLYYPVEKFLSNYTDILITMNQEDYNFARKRMKAKYIYNIYGVGVDLKNYLVPTITSKDKRNEFSIPADATVIISVGELIKRKNHQAAIKAISKINTSNIYYIICGQGKLKGKLIKLCKKLNVEHRILILDYRDDIVDLLHMSDIFLFPSLQEGLPVALVEAMAAGLPCIASDIRGTVDLITDRKGGFLCGANNSDEYKSAIEKIISDTKLKSVMGEYNRNALQSFDTPAVIKQLKEIYDSVF